MAESLGKCNNPRPVDIGRIQERQAGTHDLLRPPSTVEPLARTVADGRFQELETGHFMATQTPELVAAAFNAFLAEIEGHPG